ncbi:NAD(P)H dehydrogenase (quinone) [Pseudooceanicola antarcticus]|uniref:Flavodoxin family protein n=1 Tax=Pseudooceanicola antarcticus TaxID=1247613 RepID=A0A285HZZ4_9RHOB|nr:flavodoxin family protein [Pseudooceanicola antarcticus]PJE30295.1 flavodoxin family protein [Pseudooceanicola antarcticus]SNY41284.1 NAD(P)H dehydrogenase (quinone) [Pseudooceanicola antarcticus]
MSKLAITYWGGSGTITLVARAIAGGAAEAGAEPYLVDVSDLGAVDWALLEEAGAILMGSPTYMGGVAAGFKAFMDISGETIWSERRWKDKLAGGFTCGIQQAGDKLATLQALSVFAAQHAMLWVGQEAIGAPVFPERVGLNSSGTFLGLAVERALDGQLSAGCDASARLYGARVAGALNRWG